MVRPRLEYACTVWDPHTVAGVYALERVQRHAARWVLNRYHNTSSVTGMLLQLGWPMDARLCMFYKMTHGLVTIGPAEHAQPITRATRRTHPLGYIPILATKDLFKYAFYPRTIVTWNALPTPLVMAPSLDAFRGQVAQLDHTTLP